MTRFPQRSGRMMTALLLAAGAGCTALAEAPRTAPAAAERPGAAPQATAVAPDTAPLAPSRRVAAVSDRPATADVPAGFAAWRAGFRRRALAAGIRADVFDAAFRGVGVNATVLKRDAYQPEFARPIWDYLESAASQSRVANGRAKAGRHADLLARIENRHGVAGEIVLAIWGLESAYGAVMGDIGVIESLATLAHEGRRRDFAEQQLIAALRILQAGDIGPDRMTGSWAGAMGHTQFIPTSFADYAVDFTGDGRRDIWADDPADALASTAAYLAQFGWSTGAPVVRRVTLPDGFDYRLADGTTPRPADAWRRLGVTPAGAGAIPAGDAVRLILPAGAEGPAWLAWPNFRVILRYNNATSYALAVAILADRIAGRGEAVATLPWPRGTRPLSRSEKQALQRGLTALGHDTNGVDGIIGPDTRRAVRAFQAARGLTPDGYVSAGLLDAVRGAGG